MTLHLKRAKVFKKDKTTGQWIFVGRTGEKTKAKIEEGDELCIESILIKAGEVNANGEIFSPYYLKEKRGQSVKDKDLQPRVIVGMKCIVCGEEMVLSGGGYGIRCPYCNPKKAPTKCLRCGQAQTEAVASTCDDGRPHAFPNSPRERLADYAHNTWAGWMRYMFSRSTTGPEGEVIIPQDLVKRWTRQMDTPYKDLPEKEKESDRDEADKILTLLAGVTTGVLGVRTNSSGE